MSRFVVADSVSNRCSHLRNHGRMIAERTRTPRWQDTVDRAGLGVLCFRPPVLSPQPWLKSI